MSAPPPASDTVSDTGLVPPALADRPLLADGETDALAALFRVLANPLRLRILHAVARDGERSVTDIAEAVGASTQSVSNHLQRMSDQGVVATRRDGNRVYYRLIDPCVEGVMELGLCLLGHPPAC